MTQLTCTPHPNRGDNVVYTLGQNVNIKSLAPAETFLCLKYLPDREIVTASDVADWLNKLSQQKYDNWETFAATVANDFYDHVLPQHMELVMTLAGEENLPDQHIHCVKHHPKFSLSNQIEKLFHFKQS